jgi:hypothetical protein
MISPTPSCDIFFLTGKYQDQTSHSTSYCKNCAPGTYADDTGERSCAGCSSTSFQDQWGQGR